MRLKILLSFTLILILAAGSGAVQSTAADENPIFAYQLKFDMFFSVWKPDGIAPGWFATYDGYPVKEFQKNQWVYGRINNVGQVEETQILVGSVDPRSVYMLKELPSSPFPLETKTGRAISEFWRILSAECDHFSVFYTTASMTPVAWSGKTNKAFMWNGKYWQPVPRSAGVAFIDSLRKASDSAAVKLRANGVMWTRVDTLEMANFARTAGYIWINDISAYPIIALATVHSNNGGDGSPGASRGEDGSGWDTGRN